LYIHGYRGIRLRDFGEAREKRGGERERERDIFIPHDCFSSMGDKCTDFLKIEIIDANGVLGL